MDGNMITSEQGKSEGFHSCHWQSYLNRIQIFDVSAQIT